MAEEQKLTAEQLPAHNHTLDKVLHSDLLGNNVDDHTQYIKADGTRDFSGEQSMGTNKLTNVTDPTADQDAATKKYVDDNMPAETITCVAGETISGADRPYAVFLKSSDDRVYLAEADQGVEELEVIGFAITTATAGNNITVQISGVISGFVSTSNLTAWDKYYLADQADSWWGSAPYTNIKTGGEVYLGIAISTTELLFRKEKKVHTLGDILICANDDETGSDGYNGTYTKVKEIKLAKGGALRVKFDLKKSGPSATTVYGKIYRNGVAFGTEQTSTSTTFETQSEDLDGWIEGDLLQLYVHGLVSPQTQCTTQNLRLYALKTEVATNTQTVR